MRVVGSGMEQLTISLVVLLKSMMRMKFGSLVQKKVVGSEVFMQNGFQLQQLFTLLFCQLL